MCNHGLWDELNQGIFPWIDDNIGELDAKNRLFMAVCEAVISPPRVRLRENQAGTVPRALLNRAWPQRSWIHFFSAVSSGRSGNSSSSHFGV